MSERTYYVICADNCKFESMTKEQIYDAIASATGHTPTPVDEAFITKIKEQNAQHNTKIWTGTEAEYNALAVKDPDTLYFVGGNKIQPGGALTEIVPTNLGGTGQAFADFATLADAVGSGGNWIDVSSKLKNGITILDTRFSWTFEDCKCFVYEKTFMSLVLDVSIPTAVSGTGVNSNVFKLPDFAKPKTAVSGSSLYGGHPVITMISSGNNVYVGWLETQSAPAMFSMIYFYPLATPYSE